MVLAIFLFVTAARMEVLQCILYICYLVLFKQELIQALIDSNNEINAMTLTYAEKLGYQVWRTWINTQKIDGTTLVMHKIVIANFLLQDKYNRNQFFEKTFLVADTNMKVILGTVPFPI